MQYILGFIIYLLIGAALAPYLSWRTQQRRLNGIGEFINFSVSWLIVVLYIASSKIWLWRNREKYDNYEGRF
jgi:hypothetical protein